jgi:RNA polymerase sigma-70 factor (ECF subfamily)
MSELSSLFIPYLSLASRSIAELPDLEERLGELVATARAAYPDLPLPAATFLRHLAERFPEGSAPVITFQTLHVADFYLACACAHGIPAAHAVLDAHFLPQVDAAVARVVGSGDGAVEVRQRLRERLLTPEEGKPPRIADYQGTGPLAAWLSAAAVRTALFRSG